MGARRTLVTLAFGVLALLAARPASAYEFAVRSRTIGQGHELRSLRFSVGDLQLDQRRFTQILSLDIWDLTGRLRDLRPGDPPPRGPRFYIASYLRIDHDFGDYTTGQLVVGGRSFDAIDLIPELEQRSLQLDVLFAYAAADDLFGGWLDLRLGRQLEINTLDFMSMDGLTARVKTPWHVAVEGFAGLRVRDASPLGSPMNEPDGTSGGECEEYVEGEVPGSGSWRPIDRDLFGDGDPFRNDFDLCPQRRELMPTYGGAIETRGLPWLHARLGYRRSVSPTVGLIGAPDRLENLDTGLYPNERGEAPDWGVNEERLAATVRVPLSWARKRFELVPYAGARYSFLHAAVDTAHAGVRLRAGSHAIEPEIYHSLPTFDGDSIFNVFSVEPYTDLRVTYDFWPHESPWSAYLRPWLRRYATEDASEAAGVSASDLAGGAQIGARWLDRRRALARLDLFWEDGYGGRRVGGYTTGRWRVLPDLDLGARLSVIDVDDPTRLRASGVGLGAQLGCTYRIVDDVAASVMIEENVNRTHESQLGVFAILDMAFHPETP